MKRQEAREKAFQILFQIDMNEVNPKDAINNMLETQPKDSFLNDIVEGVMENKEKLDTKITENLKNWTLSRIASVEKTVLRIATFEFLFLEDIPVSVSINEAVELANKYGEEKSGKFVNGVLSKIIEE